VGDADQGAGDKPATGRTQSGQEKVAIIGGIFAVLAAVLAAAVTGFFGLMNSHNSSSTTPTSPGTSITTSSPSMSRSSNPLPALGKVVFTDSFCTAAGGWTTASGKAGGHYSNCAFLVYANAHSIAASEPRAGAVYPVAPTGLVIEVTAHRIIGSAEGDEFGVVCRADGEGYAFLVQSNLAEIFKYSSNTGIIGSPLAAVPARVDMNVRNRLEAMCGNSSAGVYLALWVNGQKLADATDMSQPVSGGTVGLFAATSPTTQTSTEVEFENFKVIAL
jgi:hypothetical protein